MSQRLLPLITDSDFDTPLPLIVAQKWNFSLAYVETPDGLFYAIQDWIKGLTGAENPARIWSDAKRTMKQVELFDSIVELPYTARDGKTYCNGETERRAIRL
jgi:hypothetical protein